MQRHFLFLQGMPCDFMRRVGDALQMRGHRVSRINLCFADWLFWHDRRALGYRGRLAQWPAFLREFLQRQAVTDLVLLGEQRKYHREAVALAQSLNIRVMVTDFGYFRPDWITLEPNGMGAQSTMPKDPAVIRQLAAELPEIDFTPCHLDSSLRMALGDLAGSFGNLLGWMGYPHYRQSDERPHPLLYFPAMGWSLLRERSRTRQAQRDFARLQRRGRPFFVFALQLDHDFQIRAYSPFAGMEQALRQVLHSFARHAPEQCELLIKTHPWDPGLIRWSSVIARQARALALGGRVHLLQGGSLDQMMADAQGMVTVNSTAGLQALRLQKPVQVLGSAVYDIAGLTHQAGLDRFWMAPGAPDPLLLDAFIRLLVQRTQLRGVFFAPSAQHGAVIDRFAERLLSLPPA